MITMRCPKCKCEHNEETKYCKDCLEIARIQNAKSRRNRDEKAKLQQIQRQHLWYLNNKDRHHKFMSEYYQKHRKEIDEQHERIKLENKIFAVRLLGNKCCKCGYRKNLSALEFHHVDEKKEKGIAKLLCGSRERLIKELKKCILVCCRCHREIHHPEWESSIIFASSGNCSESLQSVEGLSGLNL